MKVPFHDIFPCLLVEEQQIVTIDENPWTVVLDEIVGISYRFRHHRLVLLDQVGRTWMWTYEIPIHETSVLACRDSYSRDEDGKVEILRVMRVAKTVYDYVLVK